MKETYTFKWSKGYIAYLSFLCLTGILILTICLFITKALDGSILFLSLSLLFPAIWGFYIFSLLKHNIRRIEIEPNQITITRCTGSIIHWGNILEVKPITRKWLRTYATKRNTSYKDLDTMFSMRNCHYIAQSIGPFERISNNIDELALVTLADGNKFVINYPQELFTEKGWVSIFYTFIRQLKHVFFLFTRWKSSSELFGSRLLMISWTNFICFAVWN